MKPALRGRRSLYGSWCLVHSSGAICCQSCQRVVWLAGRAVTRCSATPTCWCQWCRCWLRWLFVSCTHTLSLDCSSLLDWWRSVSSSFHFSNSSPGTEVVQLTPLRRTLASSPQSECTNCHQQDYVGSKTLLQQNPPVLYWRGSAG